MGAVVANEGQRIDIPDNSILENSLLPLSSEIRDTDLTNRTCVGQPESHCEHFFDFFNLNAHVFPGNLIQLSLSHRQ
jgi:hypothetical protein